MATTFLANIKGPQGLTGNTGPQGLPGTGAVPADDAVAGYVSTTGTSATKTAVNNAIASSVKSGVIANSVILFGTSLEAQNGNGSSTLDPGGNTTLAARGWFHWCNAYAGNQLNLIRNAGVGGNTYAQMLTRIQADVLNYVSDWVFIGGPVNDIVQGRTTALITADATAILDALKGRKVLILTAPPTAQYDTTAKKTVLAEVNRWITDLPRTRGNVVVSDPWGALADRATGNAATGMTLSGLTMSGSTATDTIHWSVSGAHRVGKRAALALTPHLANVPMVPSHNADPRSVIADPSFLTTGWTAPGSAGVLTRTAAPDTFGGNVATLTVTGRTATDAASFSYLEVIGNGRFAEGDIVQATVRVKWSGLVAHTVANACTPDLTIMSRRADGTFAAIRNIFGVAGSETIASVAEPASGEMVISSARFAITTSGNASPVDRLYLYLGWRGASDVVVTFSDLAFVKVA